MNADLAQTTVLRGQRTGWALASTVRQHTAGAQVSAILNALYRSHLKNRASDRTVAAISAQGSECAVR